MIENDLILKYLINNIINRIVLNTVGCNYCMDFNN